MAVPVVEKTEQKIFSVISIVFFVYLLILAIELIKSSAVFLINDFSNIAFLVSESSSKALGFGWLVSAVAQSGGATTSLGIVLLGAGAISLIATIYIIIGCFVGRTLTANIVSLVYKSKNKRDFRHGFEIAAVNNIYNLFLALIAIILEGGFGFFSKLSFLLGSGLKDASFLGTIPSFSQKITGLHIEKATQIPNQGLVLILGFIVLIISLEMLTRSILHFMGGRDNARTLVKKYMGSPLNAFVIGLLITFAVTSTNVTVTLLVPLAIARIITLKEAIPYVIGANIGTVTEVLIAALIIGTPIAISASMVYVLIPILGAIIFLPNINRFHNLTKFMSEKLLKISRAKALLFLIIFFLIPIFLMLF